MTVLAAKMRLTIILLVWTAAFTAAVEFGQNSESDECELTNVPCICEDGKREILVSLKEKVTAVKHSVTDDLQCVQIRDPNEACTNMSCVLRTDEFDLDEIQNYISPETSPHFIRVPPTRINLDEIEDEIYPDTYSHFNRGLSEKNELDETENPISADYSFRLNGDPLGEFDIEETQNLKSLDNNFQEIPQGRLSGGRKRRSRPDACNILEMKNAEVSCLEWKKAKMCNLECMYGHAHKLRGEPSKKTMTIYCVDFEDTWKPHGFTGCRPYFNCHIMLVDAGRIRCTQPFKDGPTCEISCWDWKTNMSTAFNTYKCKEGIVTPPLPPCAGLKRVRLIKPPK